MKCDALKPFGINLFNSVNASDCRVHFALTHLNKIDTEVDRLLAGTNVVGNDIRHEGLFWPPWVGLLLGKTKIM